MVRVGGVMVAGVVVVVIGGEMSLRRGREVLRRGSPIISHSCRIGGAVVECKRWSW